MRKLEELLSQETLNLLKDHGSYVEFETTGVNNGWFYRLGKTLGLVLSKPFVPVEKDKLHLSWLTEDVPGYVGVRLDSGDFGDSGTVYMTYSQARELGKQLLNFTGGV